jgi:outer membrane biosynthesis protein TonB
MENIYDQAWTAAHESLSGNEDMSDEEKGKALACIGVYLAFTTGHETCAMVDTTVQHLVSANYEANQSEEWTEDEVKKLYSWYEGYSTLCGERPTYEEPQAEEEQTEGEMSEEEQTGEEQSEEQTEEEQTEEVQTEEQTEEETQEEEPQVEETQEEETQEEDTSA